MYVILDGRNMSKTIECQNCWSTIGYEKKDVQTDSEHSFYGRVLIEYIVCPICDKRIKLSERNTAV